jgi:hypothetical protein
MRYTVEERGSAGFIVRDTNTGRVVSSHGGDSDSAQARAYCLNKWWSSVTARQDGASGGTRPECVGD